MDRSAAEVRFRRVFDDHYVSILRYFIRRIGQEDAPNATDEVCLVGWRRLDRLPPEPETLPWLYGIARRVPANHERGARRRATWTSGGE